MVDPTNYQKNVKHMMSHNVLKSTANPEDGISRKDFELEISFKAADDADCSILLRRTEILLEKNGVEILKETERSFAGKPKQISGSQLRANWVVWRADGHVYISLHRSTEDCKKKLAIRTYDGEWDAKSRRTRRQYLLPADFLRGKIHDAEDLAYIKRRTKAVPPETASKVVPKEYGQYDASDVRDRISKVRRERNRLIDERKKVKDELMKRMMKRMQEYDDSIKLTAIEINKLNKRFIDTINQTLEGYKKRKREVDAPLRESDDKIAELKAKLAREEKNREKIAAQLEPQLRDDMDSIQRCENILELAEAGTGEIQDIDLTDLPVADAELVLQ